MQLCIFSDTHGSADAVSRIVLSHPKADRFVFCGDGERDIRRFLAAHPAYAPRFLCVQGNCDYASQYPPIAALALPFGHKLIAVHGHRYTYGDFDGNLATVAAAQNADLVVFGHLHMRIDRTVNGIRLFSPGSAACPRDGKAPAFGLIDIFETGILTAHGDVPRTAS